MKEGEGCGQHGEDRILYWLFKDQDEGFVVDVGAADGFWNSNSIRLLNTGGWGGICIEPEPTQFEKLQEMYKDNPQVSCVNCAIGLTEGEKTFYCCEQVSTFKEEVKISAEVNHGVSYTETKVFMRPLTQVLKEYNCPREIDFLSIDVEGMNYEAWQSLNLFSYTPKLVCMEGSKYQMNGYKEFCRLGGNTFYLREDLCKIL